MYSLGVDIGTTSVVAAVDRGDGAEVVVLGQSAVALPAVVHRHDDGSLRTGEAAARRAVATPHRVATALVRRLVDASPVVLGEHPQSVTTLLCVQLRDVLDAVREQEGDDPARLVLTRPTAWGAFREELFAQVPARLGWDDVTVVGDAAAAAAHHRRRHGRTGPETVAVLDLGAGADATVLRFAGDGRDEVPQPVGAPEGLEDFAQACDDALVDLVDEACGGGLRGAAGDPAQSTALARLRVECAAAKEALSRDAEVLVPVVLAGRHRDVEVTRGAFEERVGPTVDAAVAALMRTVRAAGLDPADLEALPTVLLVGGGARIPLVARRASAALGRAVVADVRAPWAPALGAAGLAAAAGPRDPSRVPEGPFRTWTPPRGVTPTAGDPEHEAAEPRAVEPVSAAPPDPEDDGPHVAVPHDDDSPTGPIPRVAAGDDPDATVRVARHEPVVAPLDLARPHDEEDEGDDRDEPDRDAPDGPEPDRDEPAAGPPPEPDFRPVARRRAGKGWAFGVAAVVAVALVVVAVLLLAGGSPDPPAPSAPAAAPPVLPASLGPGPTSVAASVAVPRSGPDLRGAPTPGIAAFSPNGRLLYLADRATDTVTVVDTRDPGPRTTVAVPAGPPQYLTVAPDGRRVYASVWDDARTTAAVAVIDTVSRSVVATVPVRSRPFGLAVSPDGRTLWVPNQDTADVTVIDTARNAVVRDVTVSSNPHWVAFSRDGSRVYVSLEDDDQVVELDPATDREISRVPTGSGPYALAVHPTRPLALVSNYAADSVTAFDTEANRTLATIPVGRLPQVVAWAPDGRFAYVANTTDATVSVIDAATLAVTATLPTPPRPTGIAVAPDGRSAYVTCEGALAVLDLAA